MADGWAWWEEESGTEAPELSKPTQCWTARQTMCPLQSHSSQVVINYTRRVVWALQRDAKENDKRWQGSPERGGASAQAWQLLLDPLSLCRSKKR